MSFTALHRGYYTALTFSNVGLKIQQTILQNYSHFFKSKTTYKIKFCTLKKKRRLKVLHSALNYVFSKVPEGAIGEICFPSLGSRVKICAI